MGRRAIDDGTWFDTDKAEHFDEGKWWDGRNHRSMATGDQFEHQQLWRTAGGAWVLKCWSDWQGSGQSWTRINNEEAARWLVANGREPHPACAEEYAALEVK